MADLPSIGSLNESITLQRYSAYKQDSGAYVYSWTTLATVMAAVNVDLVDEDPVNNQPTGIDVVSFTIRNYSGFSRLRRIIWNGYTYDVKGIIVLNRRFQKIKAKLADGNPTP